MDNGKTGSIGSVESDSILFTVVKYGQMVGVGIFALLSVWALVIIYIQMSRKHEEKDGLEEDKKQTVKSSEEIRTNGNDLTANPVTLNSQTNSSEAQSEDAWLPDDKKNFGLSITALDTQDRCEHAADLEEHTVRQTHKVTAHTDMLRVHAEPKNHISQLQEVSNDGSCHPVTDAHSDSDVGCNNEKGERAMAKLDARHNKQPQEGSFKEMDTEATSVNSPSEYPTPRTHHGYACTDPTHLSGLRDMSFDKTEELDPESNSADEKVDIRKEASSDSSLDLGESEKPEPEADLAGKCVLLEEVAVEQPSASCPAGTEALEKTGSHILEDPVHNRVVTVRFCVHYITGSPSQKIAVAGSLAELGAWHSSVELQPESDGFWGGTVALPADTQVEWKFVVVEGGMVQRWEECENRQLDTARGRDITLHKWWGSL